MFFLGLAVGILVLPIALCVFVCIALIAQRRAALRNLERAIEELARDAWRYDYVLHSRDETGVVLLLERRTGPDGKNFICALFPVNSWRATYVSKLQTFLRARELLFQEQEMAVRQKDRKAWGEKQIGQSLSVLSVDLGEDLSFAHETIRAVLDEVFEIRRRGRWLQERKQKKGRKPGFDQPGA
jgi:heme exporter protein D